MSANPNEEIGNLLIHRHVGDSVVIGTGADAITITVEKIGENRVQLYFRGPRRIAIDRGETRQARDAQTRAMRLRGDDHNSGRAGDGGQ